MVARGEQVTTGKLTEQDVRHIRQLSADGLSLRRIAVKYEVDHRTIRLIVNYITWRHVR